MDNQKQKKKKSVMDTLSATMVLVLIVRHSHRLPFGNHRGQILGT